MGFKKEIKKLRTKALKGKGDANYILGYAAALDDVEVLYTDIIREYTR